MMTSFIITLSLFKAPSSGGAFPFQPLAERLFCNARHHSSGKRQLLPAPQSLPRTIDFPLMQP
ncbi:hypothetical protein DBY68_000185 [Pseudocitrobacter sp. RIT415]|nr:hypothetical protein DBY68_000185 [Pseudocitrobacter sp. RIT 415]